MKKLVMVLVGLVLAGSVYGASVTITIPDDKVPVLVVALSAAHPELAWSTPQEKIASVKILLIRYLQREELGYRNSLIQRAAMESTMANKVTDIAE